MNQNSAISSAADIALGFSILIVLGMASKGWDDRLPLYVAAFEYRMVTMTLMYDIATHAEDNNLMNRLLQLLMVSQVSAMQETSFEPECWKYLKTASWHFF